MDEVDYESIFMALPSAKMVIKADDPRFTLIAENEVHARLLYGDQPHYSTGKAFLEAFPDTSQKYLETGVSDVIESVRTVIRTGKSDRLPDIRYDLADKDGNYIERWWRATHYPIKDAGGKVIQVLQETKDITDELAAKRGMERAQAQLDLALSVGLVSSFNWDIQGDTVVGDKNPAAMFGMSAEDAKKGLPLQTFISSIYEDDRERVGASIQRTVDKGEPYEAEYRTVDVRGKTSWVIARGAVDRDDDGRPSHFVGILIDITARKEAEAELEDVKRMFDALFNSTILSVALANTKGEVLDANATFLRSFGYDRKDLATGLSTTMLTAPASRVATKEMYDALERSGESHPLEKEYVRKDGSTFQGLVGAARLPQSPDRFIAFILDVSENRRLKELNAAKDEFIALASHQLRTPATAVKQYLGIILEGYAGEVDETQRGYLQTANDSNDRELMIINDLLKTAQIDTKGFAITPKETDMTALIRDAIDGLKPATDLKMQTVEFGRDEPLLAHVDVEETKIVIANLIENAHKYSSDKKTIRVGLGAKNGKVIVTVRDEGVGIGPGDQASIFEKFTRVDNPLSDTVGGNGLGLYWVKRIVTLHGGTLSLESEVGKGTTFMVSLPQ